MKLTDISLKRPVFATVLILALIVLGLVSYTSLNVDEYPAMDIPYVAVSIAYPGAAPEQVETKITQKVEEGLSSTPGVKHMTSTIREGVSTTLIEFTLETPPAQAAQDVRDKIGRIRGQLPDDADEPIIMRFDPGEAPIASLVVTGNMDTRELTSVVEDVIKQRLESVNGVGSINVQGSTEREIQIQLDKDKLAAYGLTVSEIMDGLRNENIDMPGGKLTQGQREVSMRTDGSFSAVNDFLNVPVGRRDNTQLYLYNVAKVIDGTVEKSSVTKLNGQTAIGLDIMKQSGTNTVQVVDDLKKTIEGIKKDLPNGVEITIVRDNSKNIRESVDDVLFNLVVGGLLAVAIVFLFLGNWRSTLISAIAIPASIISTFFVMKLLHFTLNTMSLLGLSLAVGLLIDDAIVVIENIVRHMEMGKDKMRAASEGTGEIGLAVTATTLTLVAVFAPVGMMDGVVGQYFQQFGITVAFSVLVSLFIAFTLTPLLSANYLDVGHGGGKGPVFRFINWFNNHFDRMTLKYSGFLRTALNHRKKVLAIAAIMFVASLGLLPLLGASFISDSDGAEFTVSAEIDSGMSVKGASDLADRISDIIRTAPEVTTIYSTANVDSISTFVKLTDKHDRKRSDNQIIEDLRGQLSSLPGAQISVTKKSSMGSSKPVSLVVRGESLDTLAEIAEKAQRVIEGTYGATDVTSSHKPGKPDAQISINRDKAADLGITTASVADTLRAMFNGSVVSQYKDGDDRFDVRVRLAPDDRQSLEDLTGIYLAGKYKDSGGQSVMVPLSQVTDTVYATSPGEIRRYDRQKQIQLSANLQGTTLGEFNTQMNASLKQIQLPAGYSFVTTGESERMGDAFGSIGLALGMSVMFIFFVLAAQFESYIDPFAIMLSLPLAIIGAILGLLVMRSDLSMMSLIGIIMLMGLVTKNAILLIDFAKQRREEGIDRDTALVEAAQVRMRPIMMTTAAMIFGMLPLAIGFGPGAEARAPMAHAIIGGLVTSTILTLVVVPVVYSLLDDAKHKLSEWKANLFASKDRLQEEQE